MNNRRDNARRSDRREHDEGGYGRENARYGSRRADRAAAEGHPSRAGERDTGRPARADRACAPRPRRSVRGERDASPSYADRSAYSARADRPSVADRSAARFSRSTHDARSARSRAEAAARAASGDAPSAHDRMTQSDYSRVRKRRKRKLIVTALSLVLVAALAIAGAAWAYLQTITGKLNEGVDDDLRNALVDVTYNGDPYYILLMGSDGSLERQASAEHAGDPFRADTIILARIDPQNKKVALISLPRDTRVDMGEYGTNKLNAAHALGGAALAVETVSNMAGVDIAHYAAVNFDGFAAVVDALGGVEVDVPMEINDPDAGGHLDAGLQTLSGEQALILCRARHAYDEYGPGDLYRAANQRLVLSAIAKKLLSSDPVTIANAVQNMAQYIVTDMDIMDIVGTANSLRGLDTDANMFSATAPTVSEHTDAWYEVLQTAEWEKMMSRVDQGLSPLEEDVIDPVSGTILANSGGAAGAKEEFDNTRSGDVSVRNGTDVQGLAASAAELVAQLGYDTTTGNANGEFDETVVVYDDPEQRELAEEIVAALGQGKAVQNNNDYIYTGDFLVVVGADWRASE